MVPIDPLALLAFSGVTGVELEDAVVVESSEAYTTGVVLVTVSDTVVAGVPAVVVDSVSALLTAITLVETISLSLEQEIVPRKIRRPISKLTNCFIDTSQVLARDTAQTENGVEGRARTADPCLFRAMLYQLSYLDRNLKHTT